MAAIASSSLCFNSGSKIGDLFLLLGLLAHEEFVVGDVFAAISALLLLSIATGETRGMLE